MTPFNGPGALIGGCAFQWQKNGAQELDVSKNRSSFLVAGYLKRGYLLYAHSWGLPTRKRLGVFLQ